MVHTDEDEIEMKRICHGCVGETFLSAQIKSTGTEAACAYCEEEGITWPLKELADSVDQAFDEHYVLTPDYPEYSFGNQLDEWERDGEPVLEAIENAAELPSEAAADVLALLSRRHYDRGRAEIGEECEFSGDSHYAPRGTSDRFWQREWADFENTLKTQARFFSQSAAAHLTAIFGHIDKLTAKGGRPLVVDAGPGLPIEHLYRAREFHSERNLEIALSRPDNELAPPPAQCATAGRMNARGIAVFYGAMEPEVAVAEVRPSVGSRVAMAKFSIIRPLKLIDLTALSEAHDPGSIFDPSLRARLERVAFLRTLGRRISRPVMPGDQDLDYLATQAIADFLATENKPRLDGIIFTSAQWKSGRNIVLFHKAARVASLDIPEGTEISVSCYSHDDDGAYPDYWVSEQVQPQPDKVASNHLDIDFVLNAYAPMPHDADFREDTLRVDPESVEVRHVEQIMVTTTDFPVRRNRYVRNKKEPEF